MRCRQTRLSLLYFIKDKVHSTVAPLMKKHSDFGGCIMSDMHSLYVNVGSNESKLTPYGLYHMWTTIHKIMFIKSLLLYIL